MRESATAARWRTARRCHRPRRNARAAGGARRTGARRLNTRCRTTSAAASPSWARSNPARCVSACAGGRRRRRSVSGSSSPDSVAPSHCVATSDAGRDADRALKALRPNATTSHELIPPRSHLRTVESAPPGTDLSERRFLAEGRTRRPVASVCADGCQPGAAWERQRSGPGNEPSAAAGGTISHCRSIYPDAEYHPGPRAARRTKPTPDADAQPPRGAPATFRARRKARKAQRSKLRRRISPRMRSRRCCWS